MADELERALPPEQRGWWTREEAARYDGVLIDLCDLRYPEGRFIRGEVVTTAPPAP